MEQSAHWLGGSKQLPVFNLACAESCEFFGGARSQGLNLHGAVLEKTEAIWRAFNC